MIKIQGELIICLIKFYSLKYCYYLKISLLYINNNFIYLLIFFSINFKKIYSNLIFKIEVRLSIIINVQFHTFD